MKKKYEQHILNLLTLPGFISYFYSVLSDYSHTVNPSFQAWEATERAHSRYFSKHRYNSYESFKSALSRYNKKRKKVGK